MRQEQAALIIASTIAAVLPLLLTQLVGAFSLTTGAATAGICVAILLGVGGPIVDRRARAAAAELLEHQPSNGSDPA